jgi:hypothetical protein
MVRFEKRVRGQCQLQQVSHFNCPRWLTIRLFVATCLDAAVDTCMHAVSAEYALRISCSHCTDLAINDR